MKELIGRLFFRVGLASLGLMGANRAGAQNFSAWPVSRIAAGGYQSLFTRTDGTLYVMGDNSFGELGLGPAVPGANVPQPITNGIGIIACGYFHSVYVTGRSFWTMGDNSNGQLGDGTINNHYFPEQIASVSSGFRFNAISGGGFHSLYAIFDSAIGSGGLSTMGANAYGQLGDATTNDHYSAEQVVAFTSGQPSVTAVAGGFFHTLFVRSGGSLWAMGENNSGQLGDGTTANKSSAEQIEPSGVTAVAAGTQHSVFIKSDGSLWGMGENNLGQLGDGTVIGKSSPERIVSSNVVAVAANSYYTLFIQSDGSLWGMGFNSYGQLGIGGSNYFVNTPVLIVASNVVAISAGYDHSLFLKSDGSLWGMGLNLAGQLGLGDYNDRHTPAEIVAPPPKISFVPSGNNVVLTWPTNAVGFTLQSTTNLTPPAVWTTVSPGPLVFGNQFELITPASGPGTFYRLSSP